MLLLVVLLVQESELSEIPEIKIDFEYQLANGTGSFVGEPYDENGKLVNKVLIPTITATIVAPDDANGSKKRESTSSDTYKIQHHQPAFKFDEEIVKQRTREGLKFWKYEE